MEIVGTQWRAAITVLYQIPFSLGHMSLAGFAFLFRHWQHLQIAITLPSIILLSYWWVVPESPRWLLAFGKQRAACRILQKGANINQIKNKDIPDMVRKHCLQQVKFLNFCLIVTTPKILFLLVRYRFYSHKIPMKLIFISSIISINIRCFYRIPNDHIWIIKHRSWTCFARPT